MTNDGASIVDRINSYLGPDAVKFAAGSPTTSGSFWSCDVFLGQRIYCSVCNINTREEAEWRAQAIANALNVAPPEAFK